jgi:DNA polymerase-3 subunit delta
LLDAVGNDLRELASACSQLVADTGGRVGDAAVARYHRGRAEVSGFNVADRTVEGRLGDALEQLRWALATGVAPVLITSALAQGVRSLAKVGGAPRGLRGAGLAKELGMPPWKVDRVRQQLRGWTPEGVAEALQVVAEADAQVKGGGTDPAYALEKAISQIVTARGAR